MKTTAKFKTATLSLLLIMFALSLAAQQQGSDMSQKKVRKVEAGDIQRPAAYGNDLTPPPPPPPPPSGSIHDDDNQLRQPPIPDLSEEQRQKMKALRLKMIQEITPLKNQVREKTTRLHSVLSSQPFNEKEADQLADELGKIRASMLKANIRNHMEIRKLLTPDQQIIFDAKPKPFLKQKRK
jgi:Spy/CpxP family protein refolding chaperone